MPALTLLSGASYTRGRRSTHPGASQPTHAGAPYPLMTMGEPPMEATKTKLVDYRVKNGVAWLELTDPPANTYTYEMMRDLDDAILQARFDENVHVVVIRGAGEKFFCAGANINMLKTVNPGFKYFFCLHANETLNRLEHTPELVIAGLNGHTVGGGLAIAIARETAMARGRERPQPLFQGAAAKEGLTPYVAKRNPNFTAKQRPRGLARSLPGTTQRPVISSMARPPRVRPPPARGPRLRAA